RRRQVVAPAGLGHRRLPLDNLQNQRALTARRPAFDLVVHQHAHVYLRSRLHLSRNSVGHYIQVVDSIDESRQIAHAIPVTIHEGVEVEAVDDGILVPELFDPSLQRHAPSVGSWPTVSTTRHGERKKQIFLGTFTRPHASHGRKQLSYR